MEGASGIRRPLGVAEAGSPQERHLALALAARGLACSHETFQAAVDIGPDKGWCLAFREHLAHDLLGNGAGAAPAGARALEPAHWYPGRLPRQLARMKYFQAVHLSAGRPVGPRDRSATRSWPCCRPPRRARHMATGQELFGRASAGPLR